MKGLELSHDCAYHTLKNIRVVLQSKLEKQPLGKIRGIGAELVHITNRDKR